MYIENKLPQAEYTEQHTHPPGVSVAEKCVSIEVIYDPYSPLQQ